MLTFVTVRASPFTAFRFFLELIIYSGAHAENSGDPRDQLTGVKSLEESMSDEAELPRLNAFEEARLGDLQLLRSESEH